MAANSSIEWTEATWNPVTGCTKISAGCKNCYAERLAFRLQAMGNPRYRNGFKVTLHDKPTSNPPGARTMLCEPDSSGCSWFSLPVRDDRATCGRRNRVANPRHVFQQRISSNS